MADRYILALDQGTTSSRAIIFDASGKPVASAQRPTTQLYPEPGWVNQDPAEIWSTTLTVARETLDEAGLKGSSVAGIGITNQRETLVVWDRATSQPVAPAVVWQSRQSQPQVDALIARGMAPAYQQITGLVPDAYFTGTKLAWLLETEPDLRRRADAGELLVGTVDAWLLWNLTGGKVHATDVTNASRTMLFDVHTLEWSAELLADLGIPRRLLPAVVASAGTVAECDDEILGAPVAISGIAGDQQAALFGQVCFAPGEVKNTYGTGSFLLMNTGSRAVPSRSRLLTTVAWQIGDATTYALEGSVYVSGAAVQWLRDGLGIVESSAEIEDLAASVPDAGGVTFVPALTGLGAPHWDSAARGTVLGITRGTTAAHVARATLEAIAFQTRDVIDAMVADSGVPVTALKVDGGAARNDLLLQIQADLLGVPVVRPRIVETTALGAAYLAGLGCGVWPSQHALTNLWEVDRVFTPQISAEERDARHAVWLRAIERSLNWAT